MINGEKVLIVATMKNEGPYILEWVAHHLAVGVDAFLVFTNDCDDLTDRILERLECLIPVYHRPNPKALFRDRGNWQVMAQRYARLFNIYHDAGWIYHTDVDEFLQIKTGAGQLDDFMQAVGPVDAVSFTSMPFNSSGIKRLKDRFVTAQFTQHSKPYTKLRSQPDAKVRNAIKTLLRNSVNFDMRRNHRPLMKDFSQSRHIWRDGSGTILPPDFTDGSEKAINPLVSTDLAQFNHYAIKSAESFLVKIDRGDVAGTTRLDQNRKYWESYNNVGDDDLQFATPSPRFLAAHSALMADPLLRDMHEQSFAIHKGKAARIMATNEGHEMAQRLGIVDA